MNILTFDIDNLATKYVERENHVNRNRIHNSLESRVLNLLDLLLKNELKGTFYITCDIAERFPSIVNMISEQGHDIGYLSDDHLGLTRLTTNKFEDRLHKALMKLKQAAGREITMYRARDFSIHNKTCWIYDILAKEGILTSSSVKSFQTIHSKLIMNFPQKIKTLEGSVIELPLNRTIVFKLAYSRGNIIRILPSTVLNYLFSINRSNLLCFNLNDFSTDRRCHKLEKLMGKLLISPVSRAAEVCSHINLPELNLVPPYPFRKLN